MSDRCKENNAIQSCSFENDRPMPKRRGMNTLEACCALALLAFAGSIVISSLGQFRNSVRIQQQQFVANNELVSMAEQIKLMSLAELSDDPFKRLELSKLANAQLRNAKHDLKIEMGDQDIQERKITLSIQWETKPGVWQAPMKLVLFLYFDEPVAE